MAAHLARISGCKKDLNLLFFSTSFMQSPSKTLLWEVLRKRCTLQGSCSKWSWEWKSREVTSETPACSWGSAWSFSTEYQRNNRISEHISTETHFSDFFFFPWRRKIPGGAEFACCLHYFEANLQAHGSTIHTRQCSDSPDTYKWCSAIRLGHENQRNLNLKMQPSTVPRP